MSRSEMIIPFSPLAEAHFRIEDASEYREPSSPPFGLEAWSSLRQVHGSKGYRIVRPLSSDRLEGDWHYTHEKKVGLGVFVADCTAVLLAGQNKNGSFVAAIHAGWRGTAAGILSQALNEISPVGKWRAWLSPSISPEHFEIDEPVISQFSTSDIEPFLKASRPGHFFLDLKSYQKKFLEDRGGSVWASSLCTYEQKEFFSYRQANGKLVGRHLAWISLL